MGGRTQISRLTVIGPALLIAGLLVIGSAPVALPDGYSIIRHSVSESAAQQLENGWIARLGLILAGIGTITIALTITRNWWRAQRIAAFAGGAMFFMVAVFDHRPWLPGVSVNERDDLLHSIGASILGFAFVILLTLAAWRSRKRSDIRAWWDRFAFLVVLLIPIPMNAIGSLEGAFQRAMFVIMFAWLITAWYQDHQMAPDR